jgi:RNA polymerase sigma-70 factor (ECF subfamily)
MATASLSSVFSRAVRGDRDARDELIGCYRPLIRLIANRHMRRSFSARFDESDVVQLTCIDAVDGFAKFRGRSRAEFEGWMETILRRKIWELCQQHTAAKRDVRREFLMDAAASGLSLAWNPNRSAGPVSRVLAGEAALLVAISLEQLPDDYRTAIELRYVDGLKLREIAEQMEVSVGAVAGYLRRGVQAMHECLPASVRKSLES